MIDVKHLCPRCMHFWENPSAPCPVCGFSWESMSQNPKELPVFTILAGRYLLGVKIGSGGFGITYIAMDLYEERAVAVKEFFPVSLAGRDGKDVCPLPDEENSFGAALKSFCREGTLLSRFSHVDGIVAYRDFIRENKTAYLIMDYVEGETLKQYMRRTGKTFSQKEALDLMRPILMAAGVMHKNKVLHRDISPENLILKPDHKLTLIDFGAAREYDLEKDENLTVILKHGYAPEEQYHFGSRQGPWTDIYACCAVLYQMISGIMPQDAAGRRKKDLLIPLDEIEDIDVSTDFARTVEKGMTVHATERYTTVSELLADLNRASVEPSAPEEARTFVEASAPEEARTFVEPSAPEKAHIPSGPFVSAGTSPPVGTAVSLEQESPSLADVLQKGWQASEQTSKSEKRRLRLWIPIIGGVAVIAAAVLIFGQTRGCGSTEADSFPSVYGDVREDGTVWLRTSNQSYSFEEDETGAGTWEEDIIDLTEYTFTDQEVIRSRTTAYDGGSSQTVTSVYDTYGRLVSENGTGQSIEGQWDGDTVTYTTKDENGNVLAVDTMEYDGETLISYQREYYDENGHVVAEGEYTAQIKAGKLTESVQQEIEYTGEGSDLWREELEYGADGETITSRYETHEEQLNDGSYFLSETVNEYDEQGNLLWSREDQSSYDASSGEEGKAFFERDYVYEYDKNGYVSRRIENYIDDMSSYTESTEYTYDASGNLLTETEISQDGSERITEYTYDAYGNELTCFEYDSDGPIYYTNYVYTEYINKEGYVFEPTGRTSGNGQDQLPQF